ncbi:sigma 54-interacting transcriptional regulator [bacterium]|nr:sigma 54-interacting transcriptional regulator [bacterium]
MFNSVPEGVFAVDTDYRIIAVNDAALTALDLPRLRVIGRSAREVLHAGIGGDGCQLRRTMATGRPGLTLDQRLRDSLGRTFPATLSTGALHDDEGRIIGCVVTFVDLARVRQHLDVSDPDAADAPAGAMITGDPAMKRLFDLLPTLARSASSVLIQGETGTGKNLVARTLHGLSARADGPFITVNCAALPETLLESELFGYKAGAFTGAHRDKPGRFAAAEGGTLFLDEIGDIPLGMQVKLLRVLQEKVYERLGEQTPIPCDIRFVTATHRDLDEMVAAGTFRRDLYYRVNVLNLEIPPLRDRKGDVPRLAQRFVERLSLSRGRHVTGVSSAALELLMRHNYPGNVRELENILEHAWVMCRGTVIEPRHLPRDLQLLAPTAGPAAEDGLSRVEAAYLLQVLERHGWHRGRAAAELGMHRTTLQRRLRRLGMAPRRDGRTRD